MAKVGDIIGNYRLLEELASGSFGSVYRGVHTVLTTRVVAIKILHMHLHHQQESASFFHEARILEALHHPHILHIFDVGLQETMPYIVTAFAPGGSLRQYLHRYRGKPLPIDKTISLLEQVAQALDYAHQQNIIHRDLKPENLLFDAQGNMLLADFGISSILGSLSFHQTRPYGTPAYMAPEQFRGVVSRESDQYALACIAYELLTSQRPFTAPDMIALGFKHLMEEAIPPQQLNPDVPEHIDKAIIRALSKERKQRFSNVLAFIAALQTMPKTSQQWLTEGHALKDLKQYAEALAAYEQAIRLDPNNAVAYNGKGAALWYLKQYGEALAAYEQAIRLDPNFAVAYSGKGNALWDLNRYEEALAAYEQAIRLYPNIVVDPNLTAAYRGKGATLRLLDRYEEALAAYEQAIRLYPNNAVDPNLAVAYSDKGDVLWDLNRHEEALAAYEQVIRLYPNIVGSYSLKGTMLSDLNRHEEALAAYEQAIRLDPNNASAYDSKGYTLLALKRYEEALVAYEQAIRLNPNYASAYKGKGNTLRNLNRYAEAEKAYQKARELEHS